MDALEDFSANGMKFAIFLRNYGNRCGKHKGWQRDALHHYRHEMTMDEWAELESEIRREAMMNGRRYESWYKLWGPTTQ